MSVRIDVDRVAEIVALRHSDGEVAFERALQAYASELRSYARGRRALLAALSSTADIRTPVAGVPYPLTDNRPDRG